MAAGYVVAQPNPRGSTGYGDELLAGIWGNSWGTGCYQDVMAVADALAARPEVDADRMAAMGGSFGGYMANWIGCNDARFRCLVTHAGVYEFHAFNNVTDTPAWMPHMIGFGPWEDAEAWVACSPHRKVSQWRTPTLIVHGEKDYRVPISEALALFEALQRLEVPSEMLIFPDENHWILKPRNTIAWYERVLDFVGRHTAARMPSGA